MQLAQWITHEQNPLPWRVMANRIWQYHFGRGLVATPSDFGIRCEPPVQRDALDYLASSLLDGGWSLKSLHRYIMASATWQQSSAASPAARNGADARTNQGQSVRCKVMAG